MAKKKKAPAEGAPLYMGQYASLMTILLAFFISMLSLGNEKAASFEEGLGLVQTIFNLDAGNGLLEFIRVMMPAKPEADEEAIEQDRFFLGYNKGRFQQRRFDLDNVSDAEMRYLKQVVRVATPITFDPAETVIKASDRDFLDRFANVLRNMPERSVTVACYSFTGSGGADQALAAQRAAAIVRYLMDYGRINPDRLLPMGYSESRYFGDAVPADSDQATLFLVSTAAAKTGL
jgi:outer membrane protein OmpA-like peptidoglycan-associated protein